MTSIEPDTKDWTWVVHTPCAQCGFDATTIDRADLPDRIRAAAAAWPQRLSQPDARQRPVPSVWSAVEYGAHVRDMAQVMAQRLDLMRTQENPQFPDWDQDAAAVTGDYAHAEPGAVAAELAVAVEQLASAYATVTENEWDRPGLRSNGSTFTVHTLGLYALHDLEHHAHDVAP